MESELTLRLSRKDINAIADLVCEKMLSVLRPSEPPASPEDLMTAKEVQKFLKIKPTAFYEWVKNKILPEGILVGPKIRQWRREDIVNCTRDEKRDA